jgi:uncharacterized protein YkwD
MRWAQSRESLSFGRDCLAAEMRFYMKKLFASAVLFLLLPAVCAIVAFAQAETKTIKAQAVAYIGGETPSRPRAGSESPKAANFESERKILEIINQQRAANNLPPLRWSDEVAKVARLHSENMARYKFFSHIGQDGLAVDERADAVGLGKWRAIGENIAYNRGFENPVAFTCESWMKSPSHRENLLNSRWKETGIGVAIAPDGTYYYTQVFLSR